MRSITIINRSASHVSLSVSEHGSILSASIGVPLQRTDAIEPGATVRIAIDAPHHQGSFCISTEGESPSLLVGHWSPTRLTISPETSSPTHDHAITTPQTELTGEECTVIVQAAVESSQELSLANGHATDLVLQTSVASRGRLQPAPPVRITAGEVGTWGAARLGAPPEGSATYALELAPQEQVELVWRATRSGAGCAVNARGMHGSTVGSPALDPRPTHWSGVGPHRVTVTQRAGAAGGHVCAAPFTSQCANLSLIADLQRVWRANEVALVDAHLRSGEARLPVAITGLPVRVVAELRTRGREGEVTWQVFTLPGRVSIPQGPVWHARGNNLKIVAVPFDWQAVSIEAHLDREVLATQLSVRKPTVFRYIDLVRRIEQASGWGPETVLNCLRAFAGYADSSHDWMMGWPIGSGAALRAQALGFLTPGEGTELENLSAHGLGRGRGIVVDLLGEPVAIGHVITGMNAGLDGHRNRRYQPPAESAEGTSDYLALGVANVVLPPFDNLWGETLAGDLGQSACWSIARESIVYIGPGTGAEEGELNGDIDGRILGDGASGRIYSGNGTLSALLHHYYTLRANDLAPVSASSRYAHAQEFPRELLYSQTFAFFNYYVARRSGLAQRFGRVFAGAETTAGSTRRDGIVEVAVDSFLAWYRHRGSQARGVSASVSEGEQADAREGFD